MTRGWQPLIDETLAKLREIDPDIEIRDVKEKWGILEIYASTTVEGLAIIREAHIRSLTICQSCGTTAGVGHTKKHWYRTICLPCFLQLPEYNQRDEKWYDGPIPYQFDVISKP